MSENWQPISPAEFEDLYNEQQSALTPSEAAAFSKYKVPIETATLRRSLIAGDESVFVVAKHNGGVLYFDDVEFGFNVSFVDQQGRILHPGAGQWTLAEAVRRWMVN